MKNNCSGKMSPFVVASFVLLKIQWGQALHFKGPRLFYFAYILEVYTEFQYPHVYVHTGRSVREKTQTAHYITHC